MILTVKLVMMIVCLNHLWTWPVLEVCWVPFICFNIYKYNTIYKCTIENRFLIIYVCIHLSYTIIGSSEEGGNKSEDDEGEYDNDSEEKNCHGNSINEDENMVNGHNLPTTEIPFPWNITPANNKQKQQQQDDKITAPPPQLLLTSGQLTTGCLQAAQLLIPTARGNKNWKLLLLLILIWIIY